MKLTIGKKLLFGFAFVLLLLVIESVVSISVINSTKESYKHLMDENVNNALLTKDLESHYLQQSDSVKSYLLTGDSNYLTLYDQHAQQTNKMINHMMKTYTNDEDQEVIQQLAAFQLRFEEIVNMEIALKKDGNDVGYNNLLNTSSKTISNVFQGKIDALVKGQEQLMQTGSRRSSKCCRKNKNNSYFIGDF